MVTSSSEAGYQSWGQEYMWKTDLEWGPAVLQVLLLSACPSVLTPALHALPGTVPATEAKLNNHLRVHHNITENLICLNRSG